MKLKERNEEQYRSRQIAADLELRILLYLRKAILVASLLRGRSILNFEHVHPESQKWTKCRREILF